MKIRYDKEGTKIGTITMKAKHKSISIIEKVIKEAGLSARTKKKNPAPEQPPPTRDEDRVH